MFLLVKKVLLKRKYVMAGIFCLQSNVLWLSSGTALDENFKDKLSVSVVQISKRCAMSI